MAESKSAVVVGAGLSGLAAAHRLQEAGLDVTVLERSALVGGSARTERHGPYLVDTGCDLLNETFVRYLGLVGEIGLGDRIVRCSQVVDFIRDGRPIAIDRRRPASLIRTPLLSAKGKLAFARGALQLRPKIRALDPYSLTDHAASGDQVSARELCLRHFDAEVTDHLIDPLLRAFAGTGTEHASGLSVLGAFAVGTKPLLAIRGGMSVLPEALAASLHVRTGAEVSHIDDRHDGVTVSYRNGTGSHELEAGICVLAVSYHDALRMWPTLADCEPEFGAQLKPVPLISVSLGYATAAHTPSYAVMVPTVESREALLIMMQQHKSRDRAPAGHTLATVFTEALATPQFMRRTDDEITHWAAATLERFYPELRGHRDISVVTRWPNTGYWPIPGYWKGIAAMRAAMPRRSVHATSTLFGSGGVERAVLGGERAAERVLRRQQSASTRGYL